MPPKSDKARRKGAPDISKSRDKWDSSLSNSLGEQILALKITQHFLCSALNRGLTPLSPCQAVELAS